MANMAGQESMTKREIDIAEASCAYDMEKPCAKHRVTLQIIASRFGLNVSDLWNFRRGLSARERNTSVGKRKRKQFEEVL